MLHNNYIQLNNGMLKHMLHNNYIWLNKGMCPRDAENTKQRRLLLGEHSTLLYIQLSLSLSLLPPPCVCIYCKIIIKV